MHAPSSFFVSLLSLLLAACVGTGSTPAPDAPQAEAVAGPQGTRTNGGELWLIPSPQTGVMMRATLFRPSGEGPFPLAVINHGSDQVVAARMQMAMPSFAPLTDWLLARGYAVVVPQRPGHGETGGRYLEDQGACLRAKYVESGLATADSISAAIDYMTAQTFIRPTGVLVIGNSAGGWGALALASRNPKNVAAIVNFSGGRGGRNRGRADNNCSPDRLIEAAGTYGRTALIPTLWLYAENDSFFPPEISGEMAEVFNRSGGHVEYVLVPPVPPEGHRLINTSPPGAPWVAPLSAFLSRLS